jgi:methylphosphotriester-DNA--protein-cysteine methyltransferase
MLENLKIDKRYDGFAYLAESMRNPPLLRKHHHVELELNLVLRGEITYVVNGRRYIFGRRTLLWLYPSQEHQLVSRTPDARYYVTVFRPSLIRDACHVPLYAPLKRRVPPENGVTHSSLDVEGFDLAKRTLESMMYGALDADVLNREAGFGFGSSFRFSHSDPDGLNAGLRHLMLLCWRLQSRLSSTHESVSLSPVVSRALQILSSETDPISLAKLAGQCHVSVSYLSRIFHRQIGVPLTTYRNSARLARFWEIYRQPGHRTLLSAMYEAGFGSYAQFYKVFAKAYGFGPRSALRGVSGNRPEHDPLGSS